MAASGKADFRGFVCRHPVPVRNIRPCSPYQPGKRQRRPQAAFSPSDGLFTGPEEFSLPRPTAEGPGFRSPTSGGKTCRPTCDIRPFSDCSHTLRRSARKVSCLTLTPGRPAAEYRDGGKGRPEIFPSLPTGCSVKRRTGAYADYTRPSLGRWMYQKVPEKTPASYYAALTEPSCRWPPRQRRSSYGGWSDHRRPSERWRS